MNRLAIILSSLWLCACPPGPVVPPPGPLASCAKACAAYATIGCQEGAPTPDGHSCIEVCEIARVSRVLPDDVIACLGAAESVAAIRSCGERCQGR